MVQLLLFNLNWHTRGVVNLCLPGSATSHYSLYLVQRFLKWNGAYVIPKQMGQFFAAWTDSSAATKRDLGSCTFRKLPPEKTPLGSCPLRTKPLGKYLTLFC